MPSVKTILNRKSLSEVKTAMDNKNPKAAEMLRDIRERLDDYVERLEKKQNKSKRK